MINVIIHKDINGLIHSFRVAGHAGFARKGEDVVCAAASILAINTINSIESFTDEAMDITSDEANGIINCVFTERKNGKISKDADLLLKSMVLGFNALEMQYGEYINVTEEVLDV